MDSETRTFWVAVIAGIVVMLAFASLTIHIWHMIPVVSPLIGGIVAGLLAMRGPRAGWREGTAAGVAGGVIVLLDFLIGTGILQSMTAPLALLAGSILLLVMIPYMGFLALIGGVIGGMVSPRISQKR